MAVKIKGYEEISILFSGNTPEQMHIRLNAYKWYKVVQMIKLAGYIISGVFAGLELIAKIFVM